MLGRNKESSLITVADLQIKGGVFRITMEPPHHPCVGMLTFHTLHMSGQYLVADLQIIHRNRPPQLRQDECVSGETTDRLTGRTRITVRCSIADLSAGLSSSEEEQSNEESDHCEVHANIIMNKV
jgi:hypothetical protein